MAIRTITTEISIKNEAEFKRQMQGITNSLKSMSSGMKLLDEQFKGQSNSAEYLRKKQELLKEQYDQQEARVQALTQMLESARSAYDENSNVVTKYKTQLDNASRYLIQFGRELEDTNKYLEEAEQSADGTASSIDKFGKEVKKAADESDDAADEFADLKEALANVQESAAKGDIGGLVTSLKGLGGVLAGAEIVQGLVQIKDAVFEVVDASQEYNKIMGTLETSSAAAGYTAEETAELYDSLFAVLGDTQKTATTVANLQAIGLNQQALKLLLDEVIGAWATYGDSIPIDGLAESINETIQAGKVTGVFADALNWAGVNEDTFNTRLAECVDQSERANVVLLQLESQGLAETAQAWRENNQDIVSYNQSQNEMNEATARLGELLNPAAVALRQFGADAVNTVADIVEAVENLISAYGRAREAVKDFADSNPVLSAAYSGIQNFSSFMLDVGKRNAINQIPVIGQVYNFVKDSQKSDDLWNRLINGSHANGLDYVPFDGYVAELHRGEAVLTSSEAGALRALGASTRVLGGGRSSGGSSVSSGASGGAAASQPSVTEVSIPVELTIDGATFARKMYKYRIAEDARRGTPLTGKGGR